MKKIDRIQWQYHKKYCKKYKLDIKGDYYFCRPEFWKKRIDEGRGYLQACQRYGNIEFIDKEYKKIMDRCLYGKILDVGCGYGRIVKLLDMNNITDYIGIDISSDFIDEAKRRFSDYVF